MIAAITASPKKFIKHIVFPKMILMAITADAVALEAPEFCGGFCTKPDAE